jgi:NitT/TauT family transport system permease protein
VIHDRTASALYAGGTLVFVLVAWQLAVTMLDVPAYFIPAPSDVAQALFNGRALYAANFLVTLYSTLAAFGIAFALALIMGALVSEIRFLERTLYPLLVALQSMPRIALAPIIIVWFGFGPASKIVLGTLSAFFPIFLNTVHGLKVVDPDQIALMRTLHATRSQIFWKIKLPNALPFLLAGANIGIIFAILAVIVGEFLGANRGMGYLIVNQSNQMDTPGVFANVLLLSATGLVFHYGIQALRYRLLFWARGSEIAGSDPAK